MDITKAGFQLIKEPTKTRQIERIARICYKSEDKIAEGTDIKIVHNLLKRRHLAMLEHADAVFQVNRDLYDLIDGCIRTWEQNTNDLPFDSSWETENENRNLYIKRTVTRIDNEDGSDTYRYVVSGNLRAWYEFIDLAASMDALPLKIQHYINEHVAHICDERFEQPDIRDEETGLEIPEMYFKPTSYVRPDISAKDLYIEELADLSVLTDEERMIHERFSVLFTCDRGITHELVRMRESSFAQESTRYVNYAKAKFGSEISVIEPFFFLDNEEAYGIWKEACEHAQSCYMRLTGMGVPAQQARTVLPHSTKVEIVMTTNLAEWRHIFELRACDKTGAAHPQMKEIMVPALLEIQKRYDFAFGDLEPARIMG